MYRQLANFKQPWKKLTIKLLDAIRYHEAQFLNKNFYIFGGRNAKEELKLVYKLSRNLQWEKVTNINGKRSCISNDSVILNDQIWVCGGDNEQALGNIEMYDQIINT